MKVAIFGATGGTGIELVKQALEAGHDVTAFVRDPAGLEIDHERLTVAVGDVLQPTNIEQAIAGQDAIVCALGSDDLKKTTIRTTATINIINGLQETGVKRLIVVSAMGVGDSWNALSRMGKVIYRTLLKSARTDHETQEVAVKESGLDWTIIRPSRLIDAPRTGVYEVGPDIHSEIAKISRADVADLIIKELQQNMLIGETVTITY